MYFNRENFRQLRKSKKISHRDIAIECEVHQSTISRWETGFSTPPRILIPKLATFLDVPVTEISNIVHNSFLNKNISAFTSIGCMDEKVYDNNEIFFIRNIMQQKRELKKAKLVISSLVNSMHTAFYIKDSNNKYILANSSFLKSLEQPPSLFVEGLTDDYFYPKNDAALNSRMDATVIAKEKEFINEQMHILGARKKKWGLITKVPIINDDNMVEGMLCTIKDITEEKRANELNLELASAISNIKDVIWTGTKINYQFKYTSVNNATKSIFGLSKQQFLADKWKNYIHDDYKDYVKKELHNIKIPQTEIEYKYIDPGTGKEKWLHHRVNVSGVNFFGVIKDITELQEKKELNRQNIYLQDELKILKNTIHWASTIEPKPRYIFINENFEKNTGYDRKELMAAAYLWLSKIHPDDRNRVSNIIHNDAFPQIFEYRFYTKHKGFRLFRAKNDKLKQGDKWIYVGQVADITNLVRR